MDTHIAEIIERLLSVRAALGARAFRDAAGRARVAIARAAHAEAERRARRLRRRSIARGAVIRLPLARERRGGGREP
ncbi:hypothetical protein FHR70_003484 [Microvirga lupini]|uniref:Uncharacterized protein n=1 Tax=Microvirga lupini TaxID=420324 RepID=A0A7W4VNF5_9HYPH|nr:hypothetical protein [Microvirga lupini]MBB3020403.1 hypothetical protein [Microvirga lupini]